MSPLLTMASLSLLGYHLTFDAEMSSPADMSQFVNTFQNGDTREYANHEQENYAPYDPNNPALPYNFVNGQLVITASPIPQWDQPYTSGMIETSGIFTQSQGYFEMRAAVPAGQGFWPAFWLLPTSYYPEIDILEQPNNSGTNTKYWTHTSSPSDNSGGFTDTGVDLTQGYHRYGFFWNNDIIQYVFDGQLVGYPHPTPPAMAGLQMYMILNLAVGDQYSWPGAPPAGASSTFGIDYVRAFSNDPTVPTVSLEPISSPDGVDTTPVLMPPAPATPPVVGTGTDTLVLRMAEDAYQGDAQFTVSIDGRKRGGTFTATANHFVGQYQDFAIKGDYSTARHTVAVNFLNDLSGSDGDRNLYLLGATIDGAPVSHSALTELVDGPQTVGFVNVPLAPINVGTGPDSFTLAVSQDTYAPNPRYIISVDGVQQGMPLLATAHHAFGQTQSVIVHGTFGPASHTVGVEFLNGVAPGSTPNGVNLYVESVSYDGIAAGAAPLEMSSRGTAKLTTAAQAADTLALTLAEDAWQGNAQAQISVDGVVMGSVPVTAANNASIAQSFSVQGSWGGAAVPHTVTVAYLNDAYGGPGQDRNLYVRTVTVDGKQISGAQSLMRAGTMTFAYAPPLPPPVWVINK